MDAINQFSVRLSMTGLSNTFQELLWVVPISQCIHIICVTIIMGAALMIDLRILNVAGRSQSLHAMAQRFAPWFWIAFAGVLVTGLVQIIAEPVRELVNPAFWGKMLLLAVSLVSAAAFQRAAARDARFLQRDVRTRTGAQALAVVSLVVWCSIVVLGRTIAYSQLGE